MKNIFDFMRWRKLAAIVSLSILSTSFLSFYLQGINFGLDFTGGTLVEIGYDQPANIDPIRKKLASEGYKQAQVVHFGSSHDVLIRIPSGDDIEIGEKILTILQKDAKPQLRRVEFVGPQIGDELREQGGLALLTALALVLIYVAFRFQIKFALGAVLALFHDVLVVLGIFSLLRWEFDLTVLAALLAVIGYSLNDTIVVSDRIRENFRESKAGEAADIINRSLNQIFGRTLITSLTTLLVLFALFIAGGELIKGFSAALIIGVIVGTYSSIYVVAGSLISMKISRKDLVLPKDS